jgi:hypothetical protein
MARGNKRIENGYITKVYTTDDKDIVNICFVLHLPFISAQPPFSPAGKHGIFYGHQRQQRTGDPCVPYKRRKMADENIA